MEANDRTFLIGILTKDEKATAALVAKFESSENVTVIDLVGMRSELFIKFINNARLDIAVVAEDTFANIKSMEKIDEIIKKGGNTYFIVMYTSENSKKVLEASDMLIENKMMVTPSKVDNERDYRVLATNVKGAMNGVLQNERIEAKFLSELNERLRDGR